MRRETHSTLKSELPYFLLIEFGDINTQRLLNSYNYNINVIGAYIITFIDYRSVLTLIRGETSTAGLNTVGMINEC